MDGNPIPAAHLDIVAGNTFEQQLTFKTDGTPEPLPEDGWRAWILPDLATEHVEMTVDTTRASEGVLVLFSAAKGFNLAGFKAAILVGGSATHDLIRAVPEVIADGSGTISLAAHTAALVYGGGWLDSVRAAVDARRAQFAQGLARIAPQAWVQPADGTYFAWTNLAEVPVRDGNELGGGTLLGDDPARLLLEQGQLAVNPGVSFGQGGEGFVRVNLATTPEVIAEALARIERALNR